MNDRAVGVLEQYDMEVLRTYKGRGTIICETNQGLKVLKEYTGNTHKLICLEKMQLHMKDLIHTDTLVRTKEGELFVKDTDGTIYIVKEQIEGRECNYRSEEEIRCAFRMMAKLHLAMVNQDQEAQWELPVFHYAEEMQRHTKECRHIWNYLRKLKSKTAFERALLQEYGYFLDQAVEVTAQAQQENMAGYDALIHQKGYFYHGDYQYHNVLFTPGEVCIVNLEHFGCDSGVRDLYLLFRKISEKSDWSIPLGIKMLEAYQNSRKLEGWEQRQLYYRLAYPDKFWKIANFYYNSRKSWIPDKNLEKLRQLVAQEKAKQKLLQALF